MKRVLSCVMIVVLLFGCAFAVQGERPSEWQEEEGYWFRTIQTAGGPMLIDVTFRGETEDGTVYVPKTLGGILLTPNNFYADVFWEYDCELSTIRAFRVDDDNEQFTIVENALYTKDGETALVFPDDPSSVIYTVPDGTQTIAENSLSIVCADCICIPDSVQTIESNYIPAIAANPGTAAEAYASRNGIDFVAFGADHAHRYYSFRVEPTCVQNGRNLVQCPCGKIYCDKTLPPDEVNGHCFSYVEEEYGGWYEQCINCGITWDEWEEQFEPDEPDENDCTCICHTVFHFAEKHDSDSLDKVTLYRVLIYYVKLFVWRIIGVNQYCQCGKRHY